jgi:hypothetical protein
MKSTPPTNRSVAAQRDEATVASSSNIGLIDVARPAPETSKSRRTLTSTASAKILAAKSTRANTVRSRPQVKAAKSSLKAKPVGTSSRKAAPGSKQEGILALLRRPEGASIDVLVKSTGWQPHSVRGFLAGTVRKKLKLQLQSEKVDGRRTYRIKAGKTPATTKKSRKA